MIHRQGGNHPNALAGALHKVKPRLVALQWIGNLIAILLGFAWLQIPDSHSWQFALSMISGLFIVLAFLWLHAATFRRMCAVTAPVPLPVQVLVLAIFVTLWMALSRPITAGRDVEALLAGYANSKLSPHLRSFFSFARLVQWQDHLYDVAQFVFAGFLLPPAMEIVASRVRSVSFKRAVRVYRHWTYWVVVLICGFGATQLTASLFGWTPGKGILGESFSVVARLGFAYSFDVLLWCLVLGLTAFYLDENRA
jgi:hypothetical protein